MKVGYYFLRGTSVEVAVRQVSGCGKLALISFCVGKNKYMHNLSRKEKLAIARVQVEKTVPCEWLSEHSAFTKRGLLKRNFQPVPFPDILDMEKNLLICGIIQSPVKKFNELTGVVTFATSPVRRAHYCVLRNVELPAFHFKQRVDFLVGTSARVKLVHGDEEIGLYLIGNDAFWIPKIFIGTEPVATQQVNTAKFIGTVFLHGFIPMEAYETGSKMLLRLPGETGRPQTWANGDVVNSHPLKNVEALINFKQPEKEKHMRDRNRRIAKLLAIV